MNVYIDTEFTRFDNPLTGEKAKLISIGLVTENGDEFYAEVPVNTWDCSLFVQQIVLPLLGKDPLAIRNETLLYRDLMTWLNKIRPKTGKVVICYDYHTDWDLFVEIINFVPAWIKPKNVQKYILDILFHEYYVLNDAPRHHALHDAKANKYGYRKPTKQSYTSTEEIIIEPTEL